MMTKYKVFWKKYNRLCSWLLTVCLLIIAYIICAAILHFTRIDNDAPVVFVLAVAVISRLTYRVYYGIFASLISTFAVNYFFTYPYNFFTLSLVGYPIDFVCFMAVSLLVSVLTYQLRGETAKAVRHEKETIELYEKNHRLEEERAAAELAVEKEKMHSNLLRAVSHDLRTPLTAIAGASSILMQEDEKVSPEKSKKLATDIHDEALWLSQMVENLLSVTRFQHDDAVQLKEREELVEEVLEESISKLHRRFPQQQIEVSVPEEILLVPMDAMLIEQVLINLMENAVRHAGVKAPIDVSVRKEQDRVLCSVRDYGHGISEEILPKLFGGEICQSDSGRGMGIGLSVCKSIILAHHGTISAQNCPDGGAVFKFSLPLEKEEQGDENHEHETYGNGCGG